MLHTTKKLHKQSVLDPNKQQYYIHTNNNIDTNKHIHRNKDTETTTTTDDEETAVLLVPTILPTSTTTTTKWISRVASVAGVMMLVVAGGTVWMGDGGIATTTAEGLVVATEARKDDYCVPAVGAFGGASKTNGKLFIHIHPFQTCYQNGEEAKYCWSNSYHMYGHPLNPPIDRYFQCVPVGGHWHDLDPKYVNTPGVDPTANPKRCGQPCQKMNNMA